MAYSVATLHGWRPSLGQLLGKETVHWRGSRHSFWTKRHKTRLFCFTLSTMVCESLSVLFGRVGLKPSLISSHVYQSNIEHIIRTAYTLLHLGAIYRIPRFTSEAPEILSHAWPTSLIQWDHRNQHVPETYSEAARDAGVPHPMYANHLHFVVLMHVCP